MLLLLLVIEQVVAQKFTCAAPPETKTTKQVDPAWKHLGGGLCKQNDECKNGGCRYGKCRCYGVDYYFGSMCEFAARDVGICGGHGAWNFNKERCDCDGKGLWIGQFCEVDAREYCHDNPLIEKKKECECECPKNQDLDYRCRKISDTLTSGTVRLTYEAGNGQVKEALRQIIDPNVEFTVLDDPYGKINVDLGAKTMTITFEKRMMPGAFFPAHITLLDLPMNLALCKLREGEHNLVDAVVSRQNTVSIRLNEFHMHPAQKKRFIFDIDFFLQDS